MAKPEPQTGARQRDQDEAEFRQLGALLHQKARELDEIERRYLELKGKIEGHRRRSSKD